MLHSGIRKRVTSPVVFTYTKVDLFFSFFLMFSNFLLGIRATITIAQPDILPLNNHDFPLTQRWKFYYSQTQPHKLSIMA